MSSASETTEACWTRNITTIDYSNGDRYQGSTDDYGLKHGYGRYNWANGNFYDGEYQNDMRNGKGKLASANGDFYSGEFQYNKIHGYGKLTWANGEIYDGDFKDDKMHGHGKLTMANGNIYYGEFNTGKRHGYGICTRTKYWWIHRYEGGWSNDKRHGQGVLSCLGTFVELKGEWKDDWLLVGGFPILKFLIVLYILLLLVLTWWNVSVLATGVFAFNLFPGDTNNIVRFTYTGQEVIPAEATHVTVDVEVIPRRAFAGHRNIVEVICNERVKKIERDAFRECPSLRRVIMRAIKIVESAAFFRCTALTNVECGRLEIIKEWAFGGCRSLRSINLSSARIIEVGAFAYCKALTDVKFSNKLEIIERRAFCSCASLERITLPLKDGLITRDDIFKRCNNLHQVDLVEGVHETIAALHLKEWRNDMRGEIDSISQILPNTCAGNNDSGDDGEKARSIRAWIRSVLRKIVHYQVEHDRLLHEAAATLQLVIPQDIVMYDVLPLLALPSDNLKRIRRSR